MTVQTPTRLMLLVAVLFLGATMWLVVSAQREQLLRGQAQTAAAGDLLTAMLDQETGVRGYDGTGSGEFLAPYRNGRRSFERALERAERAVDRSDAAMVGQLRAQAAIARRWQGMAALAVRRVDVQGARSLSLSGARERKVVMDEFRRANSVFREQVRARALVRLREAQWLAIGLVVLIGTLLIGAGLFLIERAARRGARRRRIEQEFIETLQGAEHESEAQALLRRHVERAVPGAAGVVLSRNPSDNVLTASTDPDAIPGLAERLDGATPRECLAVRRGTAYQRRQGDEPLLPCGICGLFPGSSQCTPSLVSGEVIGSLLVTHRKPIRRPAQETMSSAVNQAAPVLANLRNLATAEHRAATDGLTGLPNARSVRETLTRMAAQAVRSGTALSAVAVDLDHFKKLNDLHGHQAGDDALAAVGSALRRGLRVGDFAGRWGGEEFLILLPDTDAEGAGTLAQKLRELIAGLAIPAVPSGLTASLGVAGLHEHAATADELVRAADRALYGAKAAGRDRVGIAGAEPLVTVDAG